jgi:phytoene/squalene synthetase
MSLLTETMNPFSLMMDPQGVLQTMQSSQQLRGLRRHKLRPLDKPLIPLTREALASRAAFDAMIDAQALDDEDDILVN